MSTVRRIAKNSGWLMASQIINNVFAFIWTLLIAQYLGAGGFGLLSSVIAATGILGIFVDLGLSTYTIREVARDHSLAPKFLGNIIILKIIFAVLVTSFLLITLQLLDYSMVKEQLYALIGGYVIFSSFSVMYYGIYQAFEKMEYFAIGAILNSIFLFTGFLAVIFLKMNIVAFGYVYFFASIFTLIYTIIISNWKFEKAAFEVDWDFWKNTFKNALPFGVTYIFVNIYFWIDTVMLAAIQGDVPTGLYNAAYKLVVVLLSIYNVYMMAIFPVMSKYYKKSPQSLKLTYERSLKYIIIIILPIAIGVTFLAKDIILLTLGSGYLPSVFALQILIWTVVFMFINGLSNNLLGSIDKQLTVTKVTGLGALFNILANLIAIPVLSFIGASITTVVTEILMLFLFTFSLSKTNYSMGKDLLKNFWRILIPNLILVAVLSFLHVHIILVIIISAVIYMTGIILTRALDETDINIMKSIFK